MRWLLHGNLTGAAAEALQRHGHKTVALDELELPPDTSPADIIKAAHQKQLDIITTSSPLVDAPFQQPLRFDRSLVYLQMEGGDVEQDDAIDRLFSRYKRLTPGRLYTVTATRVKIRQLPAGRDSA
jgi:hypothetical protein